MSQRFNIIYIIINHFSKQIHTIPINTKLTLERIAKIYWDNVFKLYGILRKVISDQGPQFESQFMKNLYQLLGIEDNLSTAYHPQIDG